MNCKEGTRLILRQVQKLITRIPPADYVRPLPIFEGSSIGQHVRHILDFYSCLLRDADLLQIDYAQRDRDPRLEEESAIASARIEQHLRELERLEETTQVRVVADFTDDVAATRPQILSTVGRELMYAYDHAVHHLAIIKMGIRAECPHIAVPKRLGVAPSTLKWQEQQSKFKNA